MDYLRIEEQPELRRPTWVGSFLGWADAQEGASRCVRYLIRHLGAKKFASLDPEEFYDFSVVRPMAYNNQQGERVIRWPSNDFYYWRDPEGDRDLLLFLGTEPSLKWRTYTEHLVKVMEPYDVELVVNLGSLLDASPHTREPALSGGANKEELKERLEGLRIMGSGYQGPVGITSIFMDACTKLGIGHMSLWGHAPHYVQRVPNYKVTKVIAHKVTELLGLNVPLDGLDSRAKEFEAEVTKAIASSVEVSAYVKRLEHQYDSARESGESLPSPESAVQDVEQFFRGQPPDQGQFPVN